MTVNTVSVGCTTDDGLYNYISTKTSPVIFPLLSSAPLSAVRSGIDPEGMTEAVKGFGGRPAYLDEAAAIVSVTCGEESTLVKGSCVSALD